MSQGFYPGLFSISDGLHKPVPAGNLLSDMFNSQAIDFAAGYSSSNSYEPGMPLPADPAAKSTAQNYNFQGLNAADAALFLLNPHQLNPSGYNFIYLGNSLYAGAAQELLEEFCCVLREKVRAGGARGKRQPAVISGKREDSRKESPIHRFELERKKVRLLEMLDQICGMNASSSALTLRDLLRNLNGRHNWQSFLHWIPLLLQLSEKDIIEDSSDVISSLRKERRTRSIDRRYQRYCNQMKAVVSSFDSIMGMGAASPYTFLAQKAMSRHFRALKDAVSAQLRKTCLLLGEKDGGLTKGETPRLRLLEQNLWKRRSLGFDQEMWRPPRGLPDRSVKILRAWLFEHFLHPYPTDPDKHLLARQTDLSRSQVSNWFINARVRLWKPMVEEMYQRESARAQDSCGGSSQSQQHQVLREASAAPPLIAVGSSSAGDVSLTLGCRPASQGVSVEEL